MLASVHSESHSRGALPVCLGSENLNRLVSLWDLVNEFNLWRYSELLAWLTHDEALMHQMADENGGQDVLPVQKEQTVKLLKEVANFSMELGYQVCYDVASTIASSLALDNRLNISFLYAQVANTKNSLMREGFYRKFLRVNEDRKALMETELFGAEVHAAFPSARRDIAQAGDCLVAECGTAAVFHLMRAVEHSLRALATDRQIELPKTKVLELATWEEIIRQLEKAEQEIQQYPKTLARERQFAFYHGAMMEFKRFKNLFRNSVMHTRDDYDRVEAYGAFIHVQAFMKILASEISEIKITPLIWV
jgi:hypothetical protein